MKEKMLLCLVLFFFIFTFGRSCCAYSFDEGSVHCLSAGLKKYFSAYYIKAGKEEFSSHQKVLADVKDIILKNNIVSGKTNEEFRRIDNFFLLTCWLNGQLAKDDLAVNIFINPQRRIVECWLAEDVLIQKGALEVWGEREDYVLYLFDSLHLAGQSNYLSRKGEDVTFLSHGDVFFFNRPAVKAAAQERWDFLSSRYHKKPLYSPYRSEKLRRQCLLKAWKGLFLSVMEQYDADKTEIFKNEAADKLIEIGLYHELGHLWADKYFSGQDSENSEIIALLTELAFGPAPYESLNTVLSFAWRSNWQVYRYAAQYILKDFLFLIEEGALGEAQKARLRKINENSLLKRQSVLSYLTRQQIKELARKEFARMLKTARKEIMQ